MSRYTPKNFGVAPPPPCVPGGVAPKFGSEKVSRYTGVLRVSRYTVQLSGRFTSRRVSNAALANAALVLSFKHWKIYSRWWAALKNKSKKPWASIFTLSPWGIDAALAKAQITFRG